MLNGGGITGWIMCRQEDCWSIILEVVSEICPDH